MHSLYFKSRSCVIIWLQSPHFPNIDLRNVLPYLELLPEQSESNFPLLKSTWNIRTQETDYYTVRAAEHWEQCQKRKVRSTHPLKLADLLLSKFLEVVLWSEKQKWEGFLSLLPLIASSHVQTADKVKSTRQRTAVATDWGWSFTQFTLSFSRHVFPNVPGCLWGMLKLNRLMGI